MVAKGISTFQTEDHSILASDGESSLFVRHFFRGKPKVHFVLVHGAVEHSGRYKDLINYIFANYNDVALTTYDHVGHGKSGGTRAYVNSFSEYVKDFLNVCNYAYSKNIPETKTFILAHSLGGLVTLTSVLDTTYKFPYKVQGMVLASPCIRPRVLVPLISKPLLEGMNKVTPKFHLPLLYRGAELSKDPLMANEFDADPLICKFICVRMAKEIIDASNRIIGLSYYLKIPSLFLVAGDDKVVDSESTMLFAQGIEKNKVELVGYPGRYHELWNEGNRRDIFKTMKNWIDKELKESL